jgi:hypothetical protein
VWLDTPDTLRRQIQDDFAAHSTPTGSVSETTTRRKKSPSERRDATVEMTETASAGKA